MKVGFIGLGNMGAAIASNLHASGVDLTVYNRTRSKAERFDRKGVPIAKSAEETAAGSDVLFTMLTGDHALTAVMREGGVIESMRKGTIHVSMSTVSPDLIRELAGEQEKRGTRLISVPVFGRPDSAEKAQLWLVAAGHGEAIDTCRPLLDAVGRGISVVGAEPHTANVAKLAGNFMIASMLEALGESFSLIKKYGMDPRQYLEVINEALFHSPLYKNYGSIILDEAYSPAGFKMAYGLKDVRLALQAAEEVKVPMPLGSLIRDHYLSGLARGWSELDWGALAKVSAEMAGITGK